MYEVEIIFKSIIIFAMLASFSIFFMSLFLIIGLWTTKLQRNVSGSGEVKHLGGYIGLSIGGFVLGAISIVAMTLL